VQLALALFPSLHIDTARNIASRLDRGISCHRDSHRRAVSAKLYSLALPNVISV
jgi:hypothetical protein